MKKFKSIAIICALALIPSGLFAGEVVANWKNIKVRGKGKSVHKIRLNPGTYTFKLTVRTKAKHPKYRLKISQKNAVLGRKELFNTKYTTKGTQTGTFVVQARRLTSASVNAHGSNTPASASAGGSYQGTMENVDATRKIIFKVKNKKLKKLKYDLVVNKK